MGQIKTETSSFSELTFAESWALQVASPPGEPRNLRLPWILFLGRCDWPFMRELSVNAFKREQFTETLEQNFSFH